jgi:phosphate transport system ATP-binding protein
MATEDSPRGPLLPPLLVDSPDPQPPPALEVVNLHISIDSLHIVKGIDFVVYENRVTGVIGVCGSGKSVMLKTIVGTLREELPRKSTLTVEGSVLFNGTDILQLRSPSSFGMLRRQLAYVGQNPVAFPGSIYDNIALGLRYWHPDMRRSEIEERIESALRRLSIWPHAKDKLRHSAATLSGGQLQCLCLARALALKPRVLLLDEPCAYVDPISASQIEEFLQELAEAAAVLIVTHNIQQAARLSDMMLFVHLGEVVEFDDSKTMITRPKKKQTEDYITGRYG